MKKIAVFCIPAHGHTNPMLPVAEELVRRGDEVRFYSFEDFRKKIEQMVAPDKKTLKKSVKSMFFMVQTRCEVETIKY